MPRNRIRYRGFSTSSLGRQVPRNLPRKPPRPVLQPTEQFTDHPALGLAERLLASNRGLGEDTGAHSLPTHLDGSRRSETGRDAGNPGSSRHSIVGSGVTSKRRDGDRRVNGRPQTRWTCIRSRYDRMTRRCASISACRASRANSSPVHLAVLRHLGTLLADQHLPSSSEGLSLLLNAISPKKDPQTVYLGVYCTPNAAPGPPG